MKQQPVPEVYWAKPGEEAAKQVLDSFISRRLKHYASKRNDPNNFEGTSDLSPYLHFGQISAQRIAIRVGDEGDKKDKESIGMCIVHFLLSFQIHSWKSWSSDEN